MSNGLQIRLQKDPEHTYSYRLSGNSIFSDTRINALTAFEVHEPVAIFSDTRVNRRSTSKDHESVAFCGKLDFRSDGSSETVTVFEGKNWLAGKTRRIYCRKHHQGYEILVPEIGAYFIASNRELIARTFARKGATRRQHEEMLLGPPIMLALALNRQFALHASAVKINGIAVLFTGESGTGKSTLARWLSMQAGIERQADDISVLADSQGDIQLCCDFPQLKLDKNEQISGHAHPNLGGIVVIDRNGQRKIPEMTRLSPINAAQGLISHSVAAQLFDNALAREHLEFISQVQSTVPVFRLEYPEGEKIIPEIASMLSNSFN